MPNRENVRPEEVPTDTPPAAPPEAPPTPPADSPPTPPSGPPPTPPAEPPSTPPAQPPQPRLPSAADLRKRRDELKNARLAGQRAALGARIEAENEREQLSLTVWDLDPSLRAELEEKGLKVSEADSNGAVTVSW